MRRRAVQEMSLSFLDVICCGFGGIILLLMITKISLPILLDDSADELSALVAEKEETLARILDETLVVEQEVDESEADLDELIPELERLEVELLETTDRLETILAFAAARARIENDLLAAKQSLTDEMARLLGTGFQRRNNTIGGITVDSEYIIFVIDTSGSMQQGAWREVVAKVEEVLNIYPNVKGIQVLNDMGDYMFRGTREQWIEDTPSLRDQIVARLRNWNIFSNSNPVEGIETAIEHFYDPGKLISIYIFGDDFQPSQTARSVEQVVDRIDQVNVADAQNNRRVRIHAVGFPVYFDAGYTSASVTMFTLLMRELSYRNNGSFVGLPTVRR